MLRVLGSRNGQLKHIFHQPNQRFGVSDKYRSLRFADYRIFSVGRGLAPAVIFVYGTVKTVTYDKPLRQNLRFCHPTLAVPKIFCGIRLEYFDRGAKPCSLHRPQDAFRRLCSC